jgi:DNA-binding YbaB/EbfC family protein
MRGLGNMMKQAQEMQEKMKQAQDDLANVQVTGESGGGLVEVTMTCKHQVKGVKIDESLVDDLEMLGDLVAAAFNNASRKASDTSAEKMSEITSGLNLPNIPGMNLPF